MEVFFAEHWDKIVWIITTVLSVAGGWFANKRANHKTQRDELAEYREQLREDVRAAREESSRETDLLRKDFALEREKELMRIRALEGDVKTLTEARVNEMLARVRAEARSEHLESENQKLVGEVATLKSRVAELEALVRRIGKDA